MINDKNFYEVMGYPIPKNKNFFVPYSIYSLNNKLVDIDTKFSWVEKNKYLSKYINFINKYGFLYRNLPFVKLIYLSNSITFNALNENSDIDLFIICKSNRLWLCRFFSYLIFLLFRISWNFGKKQSKKFDLGFFVTEDNMNLYYISLKPIDWYLIYWIAHLVLLYDEDCDFKNRDKIFVENMWINGILSNFPLKQVIYLGNKEFCGKGIFKKIIEKLFGGIIGDFLEKLLKYIWGTIVKYKTKKMGKKAWGILINDKMLKFHGKDIRKKVNLLMKNI